MGDLVPLHARPNSLSDTRPRTARLQDPTGPHRRESPQWKGLFTRDAQAGCRCNCLGSKFAPFVHRVSDGGDLARQGEPCHRRPHAMNGPKALEKNRMRKYREQDRKRAAAAVESIRKHGSCVC